jgi:uncharacterized membrane protein
MPGGLALPCCQRCLGLYIGACVAVVLHAVLKPKPTARLLKVHGLFLLLMVPFGFHWLPHGELLRTWTGVLFGFGVVTFLWLAPSARFVTADVRRRNEVNRSAVRLVTPAASTWGRFARFAECTGYWLGLVLTLMAVPALAILGGRGSAHALAGLAALGALALVVLGLVNVGVIALELARWFRRRRVQVHA